MGVRRQAREVALQALFMCDVLGEWKIETCKFCFEHFEVSSSLTHFAATLCEGVIDNLVNIDSRLTCASENWSLSRMGRVDRSILRLATFEIAHFEEVPVNVAINEAIEIAKRFGADESPVFINGVLDKVASTVRSKLEIEVIAEPVEKEEDSVIEVSAEIAKELTKS